ncbi:TetR/AcrR family transcriptional regulator [Caballeronia sp. J97]|uniref:TetR/AcrR family transcriptional regulator n=1 Tax=Caballeronia sp. J97 TaxID=2805429 RepID=UPI002AB30AC5|nr:TetR/AcrR family transcriptional regulator [Caballeronia sp. J97]
MYYPVTLFRRPFWFIVVARTPASAGSRTLADENPMTIATTPEKAAAKSAKTTATRQPRQRDPEVTRARILDAAKKEFAKLGLDGARVEAIAARAKSNKRMIYHYFGSKENLFLEVLEEVYADIRSAEQKLDLDHLSPEDAIAALVTHTWNHYLRHPEFLNLVSNENLHKARHVKKSARFMELHQGFTSMLQRILDRGVASGAFRSGIDPRQLHITMAGISYYYLTNRFTSGLIFDFDFMDKAALDSRLAFNIDTVLRTIRKS